MSEQPLTVKLPNPMTIQELVDGGKSVAEANEIMHQRVFGHDFKRDEDGKPIEMGIGSPGNPYKASHLAALARSEERKAKSAGGMNAELIAAAVAAGVKAGLAAAKEEAL